MVINWDIIKTPYYVVGQGSRQQPQTEHSGGPLGDPSARVFEVFLTVSQSLLVDLLDGALSEVLLEL